MSAVASDVHAIFRALGDPTRKSIIEWMATGATPTATEVAAKVPMTRQGVSRHLGVLVESGLVSGARKGREVRFRLNAAPLTTAEEWLRQRASSWERALGRLESYLEDSGG